MKKYPCYTEKSKKSEEFRCVYKPSYKDLNCDGCVYRRTKEVKL